MCTHRKTNKRKNNQKQGSWFHFLGLFCTCVTEFVCVYVCVSQVPKFPTVVQTHFPLNEVAPSGRRCVIERCMAVCLYMPWTPGTHGSRLCRRFFRPPTLGCETQRNTPHYRTLITTWKPSLKTGYYWTRPAYTWSLWFLWGNLCRYFWDDTVINGWTVLKDRLPIGPVTWLDNVPKSI